MRVREAMWIASNFLHRPQNILVQQFTNLTSVTLGEI